MKILKEQRTVASDIEYIAEDVIHKYEIHYLTPNGDEKSEEFDTYEEAFDRAIWFAKNVKGFDELTDEEKMRVIKSIYIFDCVEDRDVTTAELKNTVLNILKEE